MGAENYADVARAAANPAVQHAMCEDYRAGLGVDWVADDADRNAGRQITSPLLVLWGVANHPVCHHARIPRPRETTQTLLTTSRLAHGLHSADRRPG
jgi:hypothetical protein